MTTISGWCLDARAAEKRGWDKAAHRLHLACRHPERCPCECHERRRLMEQGRRLASLRDDLIAQGVNPTELEIPLASKEKQ